MRALLLSLAFSLCAQAQSLPADPFAPVRFLAGDWVGEGSGDPGKGSGAFSFRFELDGKALVRRSSASYPAQGGRPALRHEDLMTIFAEGGKLKALYLDNEGHVIRYDATPLPQGEGVAFRSEPGPGPGFRLTYRVRTGGTVAVEFAIAPPGKPEAFAPYVEGTSRRK
ncbi:hypothetical protein [Mesoterricola silvestris]|uniref:THAP4-like heme-binding beta-barrel domain-containing protein n=1 Tax=Mesoterricola silvestris TaxID=2927979 RepID=A0AA48GMW5_9BACT|nr:hypothetical protein [Mesoterricola silvestris]BDU74259.1 hypothetical protein METEAL_34330 [Mesoterricola silvestris]